MRKRLFYADCHFHFGHIHRVGVPSRFVYVVVVFFSIVMDVLDDYNRSDYYTPTIAQEIYLSPCFHYFIHTHSILRNPHIWNY